MAILVGLLETIVKFFALSFTFTVGLGLLHWSQQYLHVGDADLIFWVSVVIAVIYGLVAVVKVNEFEGVQK